jgi:CHASE3 domain sensor protein
VPGGLTRRTFVATTVLSVIVSVSFASLVIAVIDLRDSVRRSRRAQEVLVVANNLERLVVDIETGERGYLLTHQPQFLQPWSAARAAYAERAAQLSALVSGEQEQELRVGRLMRSIGSYIVNYSVPLVESVSADSTPPDLGPTLSEGKRRLDEIRAQFDGFIGDQGALVAAREDRADALAHRAVVAGVAGLVGSLALVFLYTAYLRQGVVRPLMRGAAMARRLSEGDLDARLPVTGAGEIGELERALNSMATALAESRDGLQRLAGEQASLRRLATLVAEGRPSEEIFTAVSREMALTFDADASVIHRAEDDGIATVVARYGVDDDIMPLGLTSRPDRRTATGAALSSGRSARIDDFEAVSGADADAA